jgi:hypothetical protein
MADANLKTLIQEFHDIHPGAIKDANTAATLLLAFHVSALEHHLKIIADAFKENPPDFMKK